FFNSLTYEDSGYSVLGSNTISVGSISATFASGSVIFGSGLILPSGTPSSPFIADVTVGNAGATLQLNGPISGGGGMRNLGAGVLALGGTSANTFAGPVDVAEGTLTAKKSAALGSTAGLTEVDAGATLRLDGSGSNVVISNETLMLVGDATLASATGFNAWTGNVLLENSAGANPTIKVNGPTGALGSGSLTLFGEVEPVNKGGFDPADGFTKTGSAALVLSHNNTYDGPTDVKEGVLQIDDPAALGLGFLPPSDPRLPPPAVNFFRLTTVEIGASLHLAGSSAYTVNEQLVLKGGDGPSGEGALFNSDGISRTWLGPIQVDAAAGVGSAGTAATPFTLSGPI